MIETDPRREAHFSEFSDLGVVRAVRVDPRLVLVRAPFPSEWRPTLGVLMSQHMMLGVVISCEVRTLAGDVIRADSSWVTDDVDFSKITLLRPFLRKGTAHDRA